MNYLSALLKAGHIVVMNCVNGRVLIQFGYPVLNSPTFEGETIAEAAKKAHDHALLVAR